MSCSSPCPTIDGFKLYNDTLAHAAGDSLVARLAGSLKDTVVERLGHRVSHGRRRVLRTCTNRHPSRRPARARSCPGAERFGRGLENRMLLTMAALRASARTPASDNIGVSPRCADGGPALPEYESGRRCGASPGQLLRQAPAAEPLSASNLLESVGTLLTTDRIASAIAFAQSDHGSRREQGFERNVQNSRRCLSMRPHCLAPGARRRQTLALREAALIWRQCRVREP